MAGDIFVSLFYIPFWVYLSFCDSPVLVAKGQIIFGGPLLFVIKQHAALKNVKIISRHCLLVYKLPSRLSYDLRGGLDRFWAETHWTWPTTEDNSLTIQLCFTIDVSVRWQLSMVNYSESIACGAPILPNKNHQGWWVLPDY